MARTRAPHPGGAWAIATLAFLPLACTYSPKVTPGNLQCKDDNGCPSGYRCVGATAVVPGFCCNQPDAAACTRPPVDAAHGPDTTGKDAPPDVSRDQAPDAPVPDTLPPPDRVQPDRASDRTADAAVDAAPDASPADAATERSETGDAPTDVPADVPIGKDGGSDVPPDGTGVPPVDGPTALDTEPSVDTQLDEASDGADQTDAASDTPAVTAPQIVSIEGTGTAAPIAPRAEDSTVWNAHASDRTAAANRISSTNPVIVVTGNNLDGVTQATLTGQSGQGNHPMTIEEKTMTNLKLHWPNTLTAGGLFVLSLVAVTGTANAQVFFLQGEKGDKGDKGDTGPAAPSFGGSGIALGITDIVAPDAVAHMPDMTVTLTTTGTSLLMLFDAPFASTDAAQVVLYFTVDGTPSRATVFNVPAAGPALVQSFHYLAKGITPGNHTVEVQWYRTSGAPVQNGHTIQSRALTVLDLP